MASVDHLVSIYQELADLHDRRNQPQLRDRFLVLAADTAQRAGLTQEAERLRLVLLQLNAHHLLKGFASFTEALRSTDVQTYVNDLRLSYPPDAAEQLLESARRETKASAPGVDLLAPTLTAAGLPPTGPTGNEPLRVYRMQDESKKPAPAAAPARKVPLAQPVKPAGKAPPGGRAPVPTAYPIKPEPASPSREGGDADGTSGSWLSSLLFLLVLAAATALAIYTFAGPFLK